LCEFQKEARIGGKSPTKSPPAIAKSAVFWLNPARRGDSVTKRDSQNAAVQIRPLKKLFGCRDHFQQLNRWLLVTEDDGSSAVTNLSRIQVKQSTQDRTYCDFLERKEADRTQHVVLDQDSTQRFVGSQNFLLHRIGQQTQV
jgi:hypothetical protein